MKTINVKNQNISEHNTVGDIVRQRTCLCFYAKDKVTDVVQAMHGHHSGAVGVIDHSGRFIGMITEREILRRLFGMVPHTEEQRRFAEEDKPIGDLTAWDVMIASPHCLNSDTDIDSALDIIGMRGYRYMPVIGKDSGKLLGIVGERELFSFAQIKARRELEAKDSLLNYFMHHEPYGIGARFPQLDGVLK